MPASNSSVVRPDDPCPIDTVLSYIRRLSGDEYYGNVQISFQKGNITIIKAEQTIRPADLSQCETPRIRYEQQYPLRNSYPFEWPT